MILLVKDSELSLTTGQQRQLCLTMGHHGEVPVPHPLLTLRVQTTRKKYKVRSETSERYQSFLLMINSKDSKETKKCKGGCYTPLPRRTLSCSTSLPVISSSFCFVFLSPCRNIIPPHLVSLLSLFNFTLSLHCHSGSSLHFLLYLHFPSSNPFLRVRVRVRVCVCVCVACHEAG